MKKGLLSIGLILFCILISYAQTVSISNKKFVVNGNTSCPIYFNGANTPWESWNDFGGTYNQAKWAQDMVDLKNKGINATRIWFSCNGSGQPSIASDGTVSAPTAAFWTNCDHLFAQAQANGIYVQATMMSFDHTKTGNPNAANWRAMMNDPAKIQQYITNYLVPFVNRYKTNPYLWSIDICNEIEWIHENTDNWQCSYATLQQFVGLCAAGLHQTAVARTDGTMVLVTLGSASVKWNASKLPSGGTNSDGNKWNDANLKAQTSNNTNAYLDFYSPHFYGWMEQYYSSPFEKSPAQLGMDEKPCVVAEMPSRDPMPTPAMSLTTAFNNLKTSGWQGHMPWTANITTNLTTEVGSLADFGAAAQTFATNNSALVKPTCTVACATVAPTVTTPVTYCLNATATALTATGTALKWYADNTTTTALTAAPVPVTSAAGTINYYVSQTLLGCEGPRAMIAVKINALPAATITAAGATTFCAGGNVVLNANTGSGLTYKWNNAAGVISGATSVSYTAATTGSYTVTVSNTNCSATSAAAAVTVNTLPTATITAAAATTFCTGGNVVLNANTGSGLTYKWNNAAGVISGATSASYTAATTGSYTVTVSNTNCSATSTATAVTANTLPTAMVTAAGATTFCAGGNVVLNANTGSGLTYKWNNAAGVISGATSVSYIAATTGSYTVTVSNTNCSATSAATAVTVNTLPTATITAAAATTFCAGGNVVLNANTGSGLTYKWNNSAGIISGATSSSYTATTAGSYTVTVSNANCSATSTAIAVTVNTLPTAMVTAAGATTFCAGGNVVLNANTGSGLTYKWNNAAGVISGASNASYTAATTGSYTVTVSNANCSATSTAIAVTVNALPAATITAAGATTFCAGGNVALNANTGSGLTYKWNNAGGVISGATSASYTATTAGSYTVTVSNTNCSETSTPTTVTISTAPVWYLDADGDGKGDASTAQTSCTKPAGTYVSVAGDACPADANKLVPGACGCGNLETDTDGDTTPDCIDTDDDNDGITDTNDCVPLDATAGAATVWYQDVDGDGEGDPSSTLNACTEPAGYVSIAGDGCPTDANKTIPGVCGCGKAEGSCVATDIQTGLSTALQIYPNPSETDFTIVAGAGHFTVTFYNASGLEVFRGEYDSEAHVGSELKQGMYLIRIEQQGITETRKIIKK